MGTTIRLQAADGHGFSAYSAGPKDAAFGLVVVQEIFGVNSHMRHVCDVFAEAGFAAIAPALFDRAEPDAELGYTQEDVAKGLALRAKVPEDGMMADVAATAAALGGKKLGIVGYCWGGSISWWGATRTSLFSAASGWYGGGIAATRTEVPNCPVQLHFGEADHGIPLTDVEAIKSAQPKVEVYVYPGAGHGFGCEQRPSFDQAAYDLAQQRTLTFFRTHL